MQSFKDYLEKLKSGEITKPVNEEYNKFQQYLTGRKAQQWTNDISSFYEKVQNDFQSRQNHYNAPDSIRQYKSEVETDIRGLLDSYTYAERYAEQIQDEEKKKAYLEGIQEMRGYLDKLPGNLDKEADYWGQWKDEKDYDLYQFGNGLRTLPQEEILKRQNELDLQEHEIKHSSGMSVDEKSQALEELRSRQDLVENQYQYNEFQKSLWEEAKERIQAEDPLYLEVKKQGDALGKLYKGRPDMVYVTALGQEIPWIEGAMMQALELEKQQNQPFDQELYDAGFRKNRDLGRKMADDLSLTAWGTISAAILSGMDQFSQGLNGLRYSPLPQPPSPMEFATQEIRDNIEFGPNILGSNLGQLLFDAGSAVVNMLPSMAFGALTGGSGAFLLGTSAGGNSYQSAMRQGYNRKEALLYGLANGLMEGGLQYGLGKIPGLGGRLSSNLYSKAAGLLNSKVGRKLLKPALAIAGEGVEEYLQEILDPLVRNVTLGENNEFKLYTDEAAYSGLLGMLLGGTFSGIDSATHFLSDNTTGRLLIESDQLRDVIRLGFESDVNSSAYKAAVEMSEKLVNGDTISPAEVGAMVSDIRAQMGTRTFSRETGTPLQARAEVNVEGRIGRAEVDGISRVTGNGVEVTLQDGRTVPLENVDFEDASMAELYQSAAGYGTDTAKAFVAGYDGGLPVSMYQTGFDYLHTQGMQGVPLETAVEQADLVGRMMGTEGQFLAYTSGVNEAAALQTAADNGTMGTYKEGSGEYGGIQEAQEFRGGYSDVYRQAGEGRATGGIYGRGQTENERVRREDAQSFERRNHSSTEGMAGGQQGQVQLDHHGNSSIAYTPAQKVSPDSEAGKAAEIFGRLGIRVVITDGAFESNSRGTTVQHTDAVTAPDGTIYISSETDIPSQQIVAHESTHRLEKLGDSAYHEWYAVIASNVDLNSSTYIDRANDINIEHYHNGLNVRELDSVEPIMTELTAYLHQYITTDIDFARDTFAGMFRDWDAVVEASRELGEAIERGGETGGTGSPDASRTDGYADIRGAFGGDEALGSARGLTEEEFRDALEAGGATLGEESVNALREMSRKYTTDTAKAFVAGYNGGLPVSTYQTGFDYLHTQGMQGVPLETAVEQADLVGRMMGTEGQFLAYTSGVNEAAALQRGEEKQESEIAKDINEDDRTKINRWHYRPNDNLYIKYKKVFDNPKYYNQVTGEINWPPQDGFVDSPIDVILKPGIKIDRYGSDAGFFTSPEGTPYRMRALAPGTEAKTYSVFEVVKPIRVKSGKIAPWFDEIGGGVQYLLPDSIEDLISENKIRRINGYDNS